MIISKKFFPVLFFTATLLLSSHHPDCLAQTTEDELFFVAEKAFDDGFYDVAIRYIKQFKQDYPQSDKEIQISLLLGQCYFFKSQYLDAYNIFQGLLQYNEFKDATLYWLAETHLKGSDFKQAEKYYLDLIKLFPKSTYTPQAYYALGWTYFDQNNFPKAREYFQKLIADFPDHQLTEDAAFKIAEISYTLKNYKDSIESFKKYVLDYPKSTRHADSYFYIGESYYYLEDFLNAVSYYAKSAEIAYDNHLILMSKVSLGWSYLKLGKLDLSQRNFDEALKFSTDRKLPRDEIYLGLATLYTEMKDYLKAVTAYNEIIEKFPESKRLGEALLGKANILYLQQNLSEAVNAYQEIINKYQNIPALKEIMEKAYFGLAWSHLKAGNIDASVDVFKEIKDQAENKTVKVSALTQIGDAYQDAGELGKAIDVYDDILKNYADSPFTDYVQYRQGIALLKLDKIEAAMLSFQSLQTNFPNSKYGRDIKYYLAVAFFKKGEWTSVIEQIRDFLKAETEPDEFLAEANYILALSQFHLQDDKNALITLQKIIKNFPDQSTMIRNAELYIAQCHLKMGALQEALMELQSLTIKYPHSEVGQEALLILATHYIGAGDWDNAIAHYNKIISEYPGSDKLDIVYFELGQAYQAKEQVDLAINSFKKISNTNRDLYAKGKLAIADIFSKELDPSSSIETYKSIISHSPEFKRDAYLKIAEVYKNLKEFDKAILAYQDALKSPEGLSRIKDVELQFAIGDAFEIATMFPRAVEEYFKIPYLFPDEVSWVIKAYLRIGRIFEDEQKWEEARQIYTKILAFQTDEKKFAQERLDWISQNIGQGNVSN